MLCYPQLAQDSRRIQVKNVGFSVGELRAYTETTKEKASVARRVTESRRFEREEAVL